MMPQTVLPFKLDTTTDRMTPHGGLVLFGEFLHAMDLRRQIDAAVPGPGSAVGYQPSQFVEPLLLMLHGGGQTLEDLRQIRDDRGLRELLGLVDMPSADATQIVAEKREAKWPYKGERGYMPMVGHLAEQGLVLGDEFREGNASPGARNLEFIEHCAAQMPKGNRIAQLRADSAAYQAAIFNWCEMHRVTFAIGGDLDQAVNAVIATIPAGGVATVSRRAYCRNRACYEQDETGVSADRHAAAGAATPVCR